jgi:hypothetical protein
VQGWETNKVLVFNRCEFGCQIAHATRALVCPGLLGIGRKRFVGDAWLKVERPAFSIVERIAQRDGAQALISLLLGTWETPIPS